jgi:serine/threonine protein kinase
MGGGSSKQKDAAEDALDGVGVAAGQDPAGGESTAPGSGAPGESGAGAKVSAGEGAVQSDPGLPLPPPPPPGQPANAVSAGNERDATSNNDSGTAAAAPPATAAAPPAAAAAAPTAVATSEGRLEKRRRRKKAKQKAGVKSTGGGVAGAATGASGAVLAPHFEIAMSDLDILEAVGEGGFCRVHKARFVRDRSTVAVKKLKGLRAPDPKVLESFTKEIELHSRIRHPHVIQFFGGCTQPPDLCLVTEFMFCSLQHALDHDPAAFHPQFEVETALCVALGLNHLHCLKIIHRDLKASNVLVDRNYCNPKIADFGLSRVKLAIGETMTRGVGSPFAMAPEVFTSSSYTQAVDWYAFGVLVWQIVTKRHPYVGMKQMEIITHVVQKKERLPFGEEDAHPVLRALVEQCWHQEPDQRPVFDDVMSALEEMAEILEGSMLGAMAREAVHEEYPSQLGLGGGQQGGDPPAVAAAIAAAGGGEAAGGRGGGGGGGGEGSIGGNASVSDPTVGGINDEAAFDEMDFLNQTLTWDDVLELEQKINMQELQLEVVSLRRELEDARVNQSRSMTDNHHRSMQSKDEIMEEHAEELRRLETSVLQERMRQKIKLRKRLKQNKRKSRPDVNYALSLINNPKKLAQRLDAVNNALAETSTSSVLGTVAEEEEEEAGEGEAEAAKQVASGQEKKAPRTAEI